MLGEITNMIVRIARPDTKTGRRPKYCGLSAKINTVDLQLGTCAQSDPRATRSDECEALCPEVDVERVGSAEASLLKEIGGLVCKRRTAQDLSRPGHTGNFGSSEIRAFEAVLYWSTVFVAQLGASHQV
jgi:hypothetical protein